MLVLTRRIGDVIVIDGNIKVTVLSLNKGVARIGVDAPKEVIVNRGEIQDRINKGIPKPNKPPRN